MVWAIEFQPEAERDLELIADYLFQTYQELGDDPENAYERMVARVSAIRESAFDLSSNSHRGTMRDQFGDGVRNITINQAIIWFQIDDGAQRIKILAFFFGGQDHTRHMLARLLS